MSDIETSLIAANHSQPSFDGGESEVHQLEPHALQAATRVMTTVELLDLILSFLERYDLTKTALVSQFWLEGSRRHIWHEVENAWELFGLLAPLRAIRGNNGYVRYVVTILTLLSYLCTGIRTYTESSGLASIPALRLARA